MRYLGLAVMVVTSAVAGTEAYPAAAEATGPALLHVPTTSAPYGRAISVTATSTCAAGSSCSARLFYRATAPAPTTAVPGIVNEGGFQVASMQRGAATTAEGREAVDWSAVIPASAVTTKGVDYFIEADHGGMLSRFPGSTAAGGVGAVGSYVHVLVLSPPVIAHVPVPFAIAGRPLDVGTDVSCSSGSCSATLYYRRTPATVDATVGWASAAMQPQGAGISLGDAGVLLRYVGQIPAGSVDTTGVDYYLHVADGHTQAYSPGTTYEGWYAPRDGTRIPAANHHVHVVEPPRIVHVPPASTAYRGAIQISATSNCAAAKQCTATLYYRTTTPGVLSASAFTSTAMSVTRITGIDGLDIVAVLGEIPGTAADTRGVDYFFSVTDGTATSWWPGTTPVDGPGVWVDGSRAVYHHVHVQEPVHIAHVPPTAARALRELVVDAEVTCATEQCSVLAHYTPTPDVPGTYRTIAMGRTFVANTNPPTRVERWQVTIPATDVTTRGVAYYFTASDGYTNSAAPGTTYWGAYVAADGGAVSPGTARFVARVVDPPHLVHVPVLAAAEGEPVRIEARSNCAGSCSGVLHWRVSGGAWQSIPMTVATMALQVYGNDAVAYVGVIDRTAVTPAGLEYRVEIRDGYVTESTPTYPAVVVPERLVRHTAGDVAFQGSAHLPRFPCDRDPLEGNPCTGGSFRGDWATTLSGVYGTSSFEVAWSTSSGDAIRADFVYSEWDCFNGVETVLGFAKGSGSGEAGPGAVQGKWQVAGETFGRDVTRASLTFDFTWTRTFNGAELVIEPTSLVVEVSGLGPRVVVVGRQTGTAAFAVPVAGETAIPTCDQPMANVEGQIAGSVEIASSAVIA